MNALKRLFAVKQPLDLNNNEQGLVETPKSIENDIQTYYQDGYKSAIEATGSSVVFETCLEDVYEKFLGRCRDDENEQQRLNAPLIAEKEKQRSILNARETLMAIKEDNLDQINQKILKIENDIANVRNEPEKYGIDATKKPKAQFFIGIIILLPITLYLLVFYISASYSAFFKKFDSTAVIAAIFDANALSKAYNDGWLEAVFVCTIPFAFMGLGYLIHMFQKEKGTGKIKIAALFFITFIFDSILAYQIEKKIYDIEKTLSSEPFNLQIALTSVEFWGIIFAGFVVYIIWGLVFDFVMKEHDNIDKIKVFINKLKDEKVNLINQKNDLLTQIEIVKQEISAINGQINQLQSKIDGFIFPVRKYLLYHAEYVKGWFMAIAAEIALPADKQEKLLIECKKVSSDHLEKHQIDKF